MTDVPKDIMEAAETIVDSLNRFEPICSCSEPDMQMSEFGDYLNRDDVIAALSALIAERERRTSSPGWPDPLESPQAEAIRSGKIDDVEIRNLFDQMEREIQVHRKAFCERRTPDVLTVPDGWKLVPIEPCPEMVGAWYRYKNGHHFADEPPPSDRSDYGAYRAMLAAAPSLSSGAGRSEERG